MYPDQDAADESKLLDSLTAAVGSCNASTVPLVNYSFKVSVTKLFFDGERADARGADLIWALYNLLSFVGARTRAVRLRLDEGVEEIRRCHDTYLSDHKQWLKDGKITEWVVDDGLNFHSRALDQMCVELATRRSFSVPHVKEKQVG